LEYWYCFIILGWLLHFGRTIFLTATEATFGTKNQFSNQQQTISLITFEHKITPPEKSDKQNKG